MPEIPNPILALAAIVAFAVLLLAVFRLQRRRRRMRDEADSPLPDYNRVLAELRRHQAAAPPAPAASAAPMAAAPRRDDLGARRELRQRRIELRPLAEGERRAYFTAWQRLQVQAGADIRRVVEQGVRLCDEVLRVRGFFGDGAVAGAPSAHVSGAPLPPLEAAALTADYGRARDIAERSARGAATTEELRQGLLVLQALFQHLLATGETPVEPRRYATG